MAPIEAISSLVAFDHSDSKMPCGCPCFKSSQTCPRSDLAFASPVWVADGGQMPQPNVHNTPPRKSVAAAYLWWLFLGGVGGHKFYLNRPGMGSLYACTFGLFYIGNLIDLFTLPSQVRAANRRMTGHIDGIDRGSQDEDLAVRDIDFERYRSTVPEVVADERKDDLKPGFGRRSQIP